MIVIYRHLKPNGEVFYIGIGSEKRAYNKKQRSKFWKNIVEKYGYEVQILKRDLTWEDACDLEKILISYYGRKDLKTGTLVNLTNGGEGTNGRIFTKEHRKRLTEAQLGNKNHRFGKVGINKNKKGGTHPASKKVICTKTGKIWDCVKDCSNELELSYDSLLKKLNGNRKNNTNLKYLRI